MQDLINFFVITASITLSLSFPLIVASLGETVSERSGVLNIGIEGYMLVGALFGYYGAFFTGSMWTGVLMGIIAGTLLSLFHAYLSITLKVNQIISGISIWFFGMGFTSYLYRVVGVRTSLERAFQNVDLWLLSDIPVIGPILFRQNLLVYTGLLLIVVFTVLMYRTPFGIIIRGTGENPLAVDMAGQNVYFTRYISVLICGAMSGLGGAYLSLALLHEFSENMTAGKGFIALCIVILANWVPWKILLGAILFAGIDAIQIRLQVIGAPVPYPILLMLPYVITAVVLVIGIGKESPPKKLTVPYTKGES